MQQAPHPDRQNSSVSHSSELIAAICAGQAPTYKGHPFASQAGGNGSGRYRVGGGRKSEGIPGRNTNRNLRGLPISPQIPRSEAGFFPRGCLPPKVLSKLNYFDKLVSYDQRSSLVKSKQESAAIFPECVLGKVGRWLTQRKTQT